MEQIVTWISENAGQIMPKELMVFLISMIPILELRGGLLAAKILGVALGPAIALCITGNIIPIPFILLFIKQIFKWLKRFKRAGRLVEKLEAHAMKRSGKVEKSEFLGLTLFVGIPLPGTGAWTGSLIASLLNMNIKKAVIAELIGIGIAAVIMSIVSYGLLGLVI